MNWPPLELPGSDALGVDADRDTQAAGFYPYDATYLPPRKPRPVREDEQ